MKYTDLSPEEIRLNIIGPLADAMICIAHANDVFVCSECLRTLDLGLCCGYHGTNDVQCE